MTTFDKIRAATRRAAHKVTLKVEEAAACTAHALHEKSLQILIDEQYEKLGELVYRDLHTEEDLENEKLAVIAKIDALFDELAEYRGEGAEAEETAETAEETAEENPEA